MHTKSLNKASAGKTVAACSKKGKIGLVREIASGDMDLEGRDACPICGATILSRTPYIEGLGHAAFDRLTVTICDACGAWLGWRADWP